MSKVSPGASLLGNRCVFLDRYDPHGGIINTVILEWITLVIYLVIGFVLRSYVLTSSRHPFPCITKYPCDVAIMSLETGQLLEIKPDATEQHHVAQELEKKHTKPESGYVDENEQIRLYMLLLFL